MGAEFEEARKQLDSLIGSKVELVITSGLYKGSYPSNLQEVENGLVGVSHPMLKGAFLPALRGTEFLMKIEGSGGSGGIHQAVAVAVRSVLNADIPLLWLKMTSALEKVQRRMFVRVPTNIKADAFFLGGIEEEDALVEVVLPPREWFTVRLFDISLGGASIPIKDNLLTYCLEGGRYLLRMKISGTAFFVVGKIVKILSKKEGNVEAGFAYEGLPASVEKIMGSYIRQQELTMRG